MVTKFSLFHGDSEVPYGQMTFNGKFVFELNKTISVSEWNKMGFIHLPDDSHKIESANLFDHLNSRLPIPLRGESNTVKINYIKKTGLRVVSDSFYLKEA